MTARIEDRGDRLVVIQSDPARRNPLGPEYYDTLRAALAQAQDPRITSVTLHGEGGYFCSGGDLRQLATRRGLPRAERVARIEVLHDLVRGIMACHVPVIAAVDGGAAGAGASLAFACDLVVAQPGARFTAAYVKAGLVPDGGLTANLARLVPRATLMRMTLLGDPVEASALHAMGAVAALADDALAGAMRLADRLAAGPAGAQGRIKALVNAAYRDDPATQMDRERDAMADSNAAPEGMEGIDAFLQKRRPDFLAVRE